MGSRDLILIAALLGVAGCAGEGVGGGELAVVGDAAPPRDESGTADAAALDNRTTAPDTIDSATPASDAPAPNPDSNTPPPPCSQRKRAAITTPAASASWRYGGGHGYPDVVDPSWCNTTVVSTTAQLEAALKAAQSGDTVYVKDGVELDLTGKSLCINQGVWLAGGRGRGGGAGALLYTYTRTKTPMLRACGSDVRLTGLRLWGSDSAQCPPEYASKTCSGTDRTGGVNCRDCEPSTYGISAGSGMHRLEVDNCEMAGFSLAAISLSASSGHAVHHNYLHHTQRQGLGYGVVLGGTTSTTCSAVIEHNRFDYYRHAVAGSGAPGQEYIARHNLALSHAIGHVYDMHGLNEKTNDGNPVAGRRIEIHDNAILQSSVYSFVLRGRPSTGAWFYRNCTARAKSSAVLQRYFTGNFSVDKTPGGASAPNTYGAAYDSCAARRFCYMPSALGPRRNAIASTLSVDDIAIGDFDGDGRADLFRTSGGAWFWSRSGSGAWAQRNSSSYTLASLRFGDFDGDGKTDVFRAGSGGWFISSAASSGWKQINTLADNVATLAFGDFDGDGKTDVFKSEGGRWYWSRSGTAAWAQRNSSSYTLASLRFGDFDGDGKTDVFRAGSAGWFISSAASSGWKQINSSGVGLASMRFGDFNGDGKTDVLYLGSDLWRVSWGGASAWRRLRIDSNAASALRVGDFDGDGKDDVLRAGCR
ncbi:MAG: VCBS repeat-containing protein [Myxococcales bacterium]|nr:VCBS repeat-containing protein [Myxococcales bacterium]